jgi:hypothetical protein
MLIQLTIHQNGSSIAICLQSYARACECRPWFNVAGGILLGCGSVDIDNTPKLE